MKNGGNSGKENVNRAISIFELLTLHFSPDVPGVEIRFFKHSVTTDLTETASNRVSF